MHWIDWTIIALPLIIVFWVAIKSRKYVNGVSDFLAAGRVAGRYVISVASGEAAMGLVSLIATFEVLYQVGFAVNGYWGRIASIVLIVLGLWGYCIYRFRETQAMTMGQFLEIRYSKTLRIYAATLQSIAGVLNYAIFPAVGARVLVYFCDLPLKVKILGMVFPTFMLVMIIMLSIAVIIITLGGQITIMVTDCIQGILSYPLYLIIVVFILCTFSWSLDILPCLIDRKSGESMLNPYDIKNLRDFNIFAVCVGLITAVLNQMAWSSNQGFTVAAANAHEQKMGAMLGIWRGGFASMMFILLALASYSFLNGPRFAHEANNVRSALAIKVTSDLAVPQAVEQVKGEIKKYIDHAKISPGIAQVIASHNGNNGNNDNIFKIAKAALESEDKAQAQEFGTIYSQLLIPSTIKKILPVGLIGLFCVIMMFMMISSDTACIHSWGSIIVQDIILPLRKKPFHPKQQLRLLRCMMVGVAATAFLFSALFRQVDYLVMFFTITSAIWLGGAGSCIVFGLYWRRGTSWGAFAALFSGAIIAIGGFISQAIWVTHLYPWIVKCHMLEPVTTLLEGISKPLNPYVVWVVEPGKFPINSQEIFFTSMMSSLSLYIVVSLLTCKEPFNLERMLHRGKYHKDGMAEIQKTPFQWKGILGTMIGINSQYSRGDKAIAYSVFVYSVVWGLGSWLFAVIWNLVTPWPINWWANWFYLNNIILAGVVGCVTTIWFTIGGTWDLCRLFDRLKNKTTNANDDGRVIDHVSTADLVNKV